MIRTTTWLLFALFAVGCEPTDGEDGDTGSTRDTNVNTDLVDVRETSPCRGRRAEVLLPEGFTRNPIYFSVQTQLITDSPSRKTGVFAVLKCEEGEDPTIELAQSVTNDGIRELNLDGEVMIENMKVRCNEDSRTGSFVDYKVTFTEIDESKDAIIFVNSVHVSEAPDRENLEQANDPYPWCVYRQYDCEHEDSCTSPEFPF